MTFGRILAISLFAVSVAGSAQAQSGSGTACRKKCDAAYSACTKGGNDANVCLRGWHSCKKQCAPGAAKAPATRLAQTAARR